MGESFSIKKVPNYSFNCRDNVNLLKKWSFNEVKNPPESSSKFNNYIVGSADSELLRNDYISESCWGYTYSFSDIFIYSGCGLFCCDYKDIKKGIIKLNLYILIK
jgi:hypothetical protein